MIDTDQLIALWRSGLTATKIAKEIGATRNAVLGKIFRLRNKGVDLDTRARLGSGKVKKPDPPKPPVFKYKATKREIARRNDDLLNRPELRGGVLFSERQQQQCAYIAGDPRDPDVKCCGRFTALGTSYCPTHRRLCYTPHRLGGRQ
jgi:hypothetical protein